MEKIDNNFRATLRFVELFLREPLIESVFDKKSDLCSGFGMWVVHIGDTDHLQSILVECPVTHTSFEPQSCDVSIGMEVEGDDIDPLLSSTHGYIRVAITA